MASGVETEHYRPSGGDAPVIFFDNDRKNINDVKSFCNNIELVLIPETPTKLLKESGKTIDSHPELWAGYNLGENEFYKYHTINNIKHNPFDINAGIRERDIKILDDWIARTEGKYPERIAIFDWDRTVTLTEHTEIPKREPEDLLTGSFREHMGRFSPYRNNSGIAPEKYIEDLLIYVCGGLERLQLIRDMFTNLHTHNIKVVILTNSHVCKENRLPYYQEIVDTLIGPPTVEIICGPMFNYHKGDAIKTYFKDFIIPLCTGPMAGGKRRRTRRRRTRRSRRRT